jgi:tetratricopeptide (TPR) repeat protein
MQRSKREHRNHGIPIGIFFLAAILCLPVTSLAVPTEVTIGPDTLMSVQDYEQQGKALMAQMNWSGLLDLTGEAISRYPDVGELYCLRGYAFRKTGRYQEAVESCTIAIGLDPRPARYANRGSALLALGRDSEALADAETALSLNTSYAPAYAVKAIALSRMGDPAGALEAIDSALSLDPEIPFFWQLKGEILTARGDCSGAREAYETSLAINSPFDPPWPGYENASVRLDGLESECPAVTTVPTQAGVHPALAIGVVLVTACLAKKR